MATAKDVKNALQTTSGGGAKKPNPLANRLTKELAKSQESKNRLMARMKSSKETMERTGTVIVTKLEAGVATFVSSVAEGRLGEKIKLGGKVDARLLVAIPGEVASIWLTAKGSDAAPHVGAFSDGVAASVIASYGREAGEAWRDKSNAPKPSTGDADLSGLRELSMTDSQLKGDDPTNRFRSASAL